MFLRLIEPLKQHRHMVLNDIPNDLRIHREVTMDRQVSKAGDLPPVDRRMKISELRRDLLHGFPDHREIAQDRVHPQLVSDELLVGVAGGIAQDLLAGAADVIQKREIIPG